MKIREGTFFLGGGGGGWGGGRARASEGSESEHQMGRAILLCELFKGSVTHLFQNFLKRNFKVWVKVNLSEILRVLKKG